MASRNMFILFSNICIKLYNSQLMPDPINILLFLVNAKLSFAIITNISVLSVSKKKKN